VIVEEDALASGRLRQPGKTTHDPVEGVYKDLRLMFLEQLPKIRRARKPQLTLIVE
jgi:hypothetical protein